MNRFDHSFEYGSSNARLTSHDYGTNRRTLYAGQMAEYEEFTANVPTWTKSYIYMGDTVLSTVRKSGTAEVTEFNHPDRLGTRVVTNQVSNIVSEQAHLPFGTALNAESTTSQSKRFTSYDRSAATGLDYAINRTYDSKQGRFTQVDPIGMKSVTLASPQTLNLYAYSGNDPINNIDPTGLGFFSWIGKLFKKVGSFYKKIWKVGFKAVIAAITTVGANAVLAILRTLGQIPVIGPIIQTIGTLIYLGVLLFTGQFLQFGKVIFAIYLQAMVDSVLSTFGGAISSEIAKHGFFKGLIWGIGKGFKYAVFNLLARGIKGFTPVYGFFCGPGAGIDGPQANEAPINDLDAACKQHDSDMRQIDLDYKDDPKGKAKAKLRADARFLKRVLFSRSQKYGANNFRVLAFIGFGIRDIGLALKGS